MEQEKRRFFVHMAASVYHVIPEEVEKCVFLDTRVRISNQY